MSVQQPAIKMPHASVMFMEVLGSRLRLAALMLAVLMNTLVVRAAAGDTVPTSSLARAVTLASWHMDGDGAAGPPADLPAADIIALQGAASPGAVRALFPAGVYHLVFSRQVLRTLPDLDQIGEPMAQLSQAHEERYTAFVVRRASDLRVLARADIADLAIAAGDDEGRAGTAIKVKLAGQQAWVVTADLQTGCAIAAPTAKSDTAPTLADSPACRALARQLGGLDAWVRARQAEGDRVILAGQLRKPIGLTADQADQRKATSEKDAKPAAPPLSRGDRELRELVPTDQRAGPIDQAPVAVEEPSAIDRVWSWIAGPPQDAPNANRTPPRPEMFDDFGMMVRSATRGGPGAIYRPKAIEEAPLGPTTHGLEAMQRHPDRPAPALCGGDAGPRHLFLLDPSVALWLVDARGDFLASGTSCAASVTLTPQSARSAAQ